MDAPVPPALPGRVPQEVHAQLGRGPLRPRLRRPLLLRRPQEQQSRSWEDVPANIKETFERIGIPEAERKFLAGVGAQYDSEMVYHSIKEELTKQGVIFTDPETAVREHPDLVKQYFGTVIPYLDNKFAALNSAVWSGGSFVYVPKGVKVDVPLQAYFRINAKSFGQFERTLIIADEGSFVHYIEGCTAPDLRHRVPAQRRGGDHRAAGRAGALHHHPELVQRRVQPRHQARRGAQGRHRGVGGRQHRRQAHDEVPVDLPDGRRGARRGALHRLRRQGPGAGHRRQGGARGQPHLLGRSRPSPSARAAGSPPTAGC